MPIFQYGATTIQWQFKVDEKLKNHYVTVERGKPVLLRGPKVDQAAQSELIRYRARWIKQRLIEVNQPMKEQFVTGSRALYRGRTYYCQVIAAPQLAVATVTFNHSKFTIHSPEGDFISLKPFKAAMQQFYLSKAHSKIAPRVRFWQNETGLTANDWRVRDIGSRWGHCTEHNIIEFHPRCMEFNGEVLDYIIVHELCHTLEKQHNKAFWQLVTKHFPNWQSCHDTVDQAGKMAL